MPTKLAVYDEMVLNNSTNVVRAKAKSIHTAKIAYYLIFATAKRETRDFILAVVDNTWVRKLREPVTLYTDVAPSKLLDHLQNLYGALRALGVLSLKIKCSTNIWTWGHPRVHQCNQGCA